VCRFPLTVAQNEQLPRWEVARMIDVERYKILETLSKPNTYAIYYRDLYERLENGRSQYYSLRASKGCSEKYTLRQTPSPAASLRLSVGSRLPTTSTDPSGFFSAFYLALGLS